jgi:hypothetical protein
MTDMKFKSLILACIVLMTLSAATLAKSSAPLQNKGTSASQTPADTSKHAKHKVRNSDLPYNSDAELYNAGSPANTMHERSGTLNPGRNFHSQGATGKQKDTVSLQGRGTQ